MRNRRWLLALGAALVMAGAGWVALGVTGGDADAQVVVACDEADLILVGDPDNLADAFVAQGCILGVTVTKEVVGPGPDGPFGFELDCGAGFIEELTLQGGQSEQIVITSSSADGFPASCQLRETQTQGGTPSECSVSDPCVTGPLVCELGPTGSITESAPFAVSEAPGGCVFIHSFTVTNTFAAGPGDGGPSDASPSAGSSGDGSAGAAGSGGGTSTGGGSETSGGAGSDAGASNADPVVAEPRFNG